MESRREIINIIKAFSGNDNIIAIPRLFVSITNDLGLAAMLNQLLYWTERSVRKDGYVYKSQKDWSDEIGAITRHTVEAFKRLAYVDTKVLKANGVPTTHYKINFDLLIKTINEYLTNANVKNDKWKCHEEHLGVSNMTNEDVTNDNSLTEITTEITHEITTDNNIYMSEVEKSDHATNRDEKYIPIAGVLSSILIKAKSVKIGKNKIKTWASDIRKLVEVDGVSLDRVNKALDWYSVNIGGDYIPVIESGSALRSKYLKIEAAMQRSGGKRGVENRPFKHYARPDNYYDDIEIIRPEDL